VRSRQTGIHLVAAKSYVDPASNRDQRVDYIFASNDLVPTHCAVVFDGSNGIEIASDHFGVFCSFASR